MSQIMNRIVGYSDELMVKQCDLLIQTFTATREKTIKENGQTKVIVEPKFKDAKETIERIEESRQYYMKLMTESLKDKKIELRDYQKDIADRGTKCKIGRAHV